MDSDKMGGNKPLTFDRYFEARIFHLVVVVVLERVKKRNFARFLA